MSRLERSFQTIGIVGNPRHDSALETHLAVYNWLKDRHYDVLVEEKIAEQLHLTEGHSLKAIGENTHLVIVIGGDGNMLGMAHHKRLLNSFIVALKKVSS